MSRFPDIVRMTDRSDKAHVRNPVLALPAMVAIRQLDPAARAILRQLLLDLRTDAHVRAEASWRRRKPPMAAYRAAVAVYAGHIARALGAAPRAMPVATDRVRPTAVPRSGRRVEEVGGRAINQGDRPMPLDTLYRHQQALDPSALTIIAGAVHGVAAAIADCRAAAVDPESDPAVILLARHLGRMAEAMAGSDDALRRACVERIAIMRGQPFGRGRARPEPPVGHRRSRIVA